MKRDELWDKWPPMRIAGSGRVRWRMTGTTRNMRHIKLNHFFAPLATQRPPSTTKFCKECHKNSIVLNPKLWSVQSDPNKPEENTMCTNIGLHNNLPKTKCLHSKSLSNLAVNFAENLTVNWHCKLGHGNVQDQNARQFNNVNRTMDNGIIVQECQFDNDGSSFSSKTP